MVPTTWQIVAFSLIHHFCWLFGDLLAGDLSLNRVLSAPHPPGPAGGPVQILLAPIKQLTFLSLLGCLVAVGRPFGWGPFKETRAWLLSGVSPRPPADKITPIPACDRLEVLFAGPTALLFTPLLRTILSIFLPQTADSVPCQL